MSNLIDLNDITTFTGLTDGDLTSLIPYAQAQAEAMLGFLEKEDKTHEEFIWDVTDTIQLDFTPVNSITSVKYQASASSDEETLESDEYRTIASEGLVISDVSFQEGYTVKVAYNIGWDTDDVTNLVKLFLCVLTVDQYYSLNPDNTLSSQIKTQEKIGDYTIKYSGLNRMNIKSFSDWADYLAMLIKKGGDTPDSAAI
jgi:hypothetical protein